MAAAGAATIHAAKYLAGDGEVRADERELEALLDAMQPGGLRNAPNSRLVRQPPAKGPRGRPRLDKIEPAVTAKLY